MHIISHKPLLANDVTAYIPQLWSRAGLIQLRENMVVGRFTHHDFSNEVASFGDIVNTRRPREFEAKRKARSTNITIQDAVSDNVQIPLNQHLHTSFLIHDVDSAKSFKELHDEYLVPAMRSLARKWDLIVMAQMWRFRQYMAGTLATASSKAGVIAIGERFNINSAPTGGRRFFINPATHSTLIALPEFSEVDKRGDTQGIRDATMGMKFNLDHFMAQNVPIIGASVEPTPLLGAIANSGGYPAGTTVMTVDTFTGDDAPIGSYITIVGDDRPRRVTARSLTSAATTSITIDFALDTAVADSAVISAYLGGLVDLVANYAAGYDEGINTDTWGSGKAPQVGQLISFGTGSAEYGVIEVSGDGDDVIVWLDRPLEASIANDSRVNLGPSGTYNFAFVRDAIATVMRPLGTPRGGGAISAVASDEALQSAVRVTFSYDHLQQATVVTCDFLGGIQVLNNLLGVLHMSSDQIGV